MKPRRRGQTLIEAVVASLVVAVAVLAIFSVILSGFGSQKKSDQREAAGLVFKQAQETLKSYVSAVPAEAGYTPGTPGAGRWQLDTSGVWALASGDHDISALLDNPAAPDGHGPLYGGTFIYTVTNSDSAGNANCLGIGAGKYAGIALNDANRCKKVVFKLTYPD